MRRWVFFPPYQMTMRHAHSHSLSQAASGGSISDAPPWRSTRQKRRRGALSDPSQSEPELAQPHKTKRKTNKHTVPHVDPLPACLTPLPTFMNPSSAHRALSPAPTTVPSFPPVIHLTAASTAPSLPTGIRSTAASTAPSLLTGIHSTRSTAFDVWEFFEQGDIESRTEHWRMVCQ